MVTGIPPRLQAGSRALPGIRACRRDRRNTGRSGRKSKPGSELTGESGDGRRMQGEGSYLRTRQEEGWVEQERAIEGRLQRYAVEGHRHNSYGPFFFGPGCQGWLTDAISPSPATFSRIHGRAARATHSPTDARRSADRANGTYKTLVVTLQPHSVKAAVATALGEESGEPSGSCIPHFACVLLRCHVLASPRCVAAAVASYRIWTPGAGSEEMFSFLPAYHLAIHSIAHRENDSRLGCFRSARLDREPPLLRYTRKGTLSRSQ